MHFPNTTYLVQSIIIHVQLRDAGLSSWVTLNCRWALPGALFFTWLQCRLGLGTWHILHTCAGEGFKSFFLEFMLLWSAISHFYSNTLREASPDSKPRDLLLIWLQKTQMRLRLIVWHFKFDNKNKTLTYKQIHELNEELFHFQLLNSEVEASAKPTLKPVVSGGGFQRPGFGFQGPPGPPGYGPGFGGPGGFGRPNFGGRGLGGGSGSISISKSISISRGGAGGAQSSASSNAGSFGKWTL